MLFQAHEVEEVLYFNGNFKVCMSNVEGPFNWWKHVQCKEINAFKYKGKRPWNIVPIFYICITMGFIQCWCKLVELYWN
jgi:hypothetical protein